MRGACSQAKNNIPFSLVRKMRWIVMLVTFLTSIVSGWLLPIVGISGLLPHFLFKLIKRNHQCKLGSPGFAP